MSLESVVSVLVAATVAIIAFRSLLVLAARVAFGVVAVVVLGRTGTSGEEVSATALLVMRELSNDSNATSLSPVVGLLKAIYPKKSPAPD